MAAKIPRSRDDDYTDTMAAERRTFAEAQSGAKLDALGKLTLAPEDCRGNIEHFLGCAQVPIGLAGPLQIHGEHAEGAFYVPMATTEGTLVASYNRGMKTLNGGGRRDGDHHRRPYAALAGIYLSQRARGEGVSCVGGRALRRDQGAGGTRRLRWGGCRKSTRTR